MEATDSERFAVSIPLGVPVAVATHTVAEVRV